MSEGCVLATQYPSFGKNMGLQRRWNHQNMMVAGNVFSLALRAKTTKNGTPNIRLVWFCKPWAKNLMVKKIKHTPKCNVGKHMPYIFSRDANLFLTRDWGLASESKALHQQGRFHLITHRTIFTSFVSKKRNRSTHKVYVNLFDCHHPHQLFICHQCLPCVALQ